MRPGRRVPFHLVTLAIPEVEIEEQPLSQTQILTFPKQIGLYNLKQFDQIEMYWGLWTMPTGASFVDLTLIGFRGWALGSGFMFPAFMASSFPLEIYAAQFLQLDTTTPAVFPFQERIRKTAADAPIATTDIVEPVRMGTRLSFPIEEDYIGFLIQHDGTDATGSQTLWGILGSE
jgi:hypothetical protein